MTLDQIDEALAQWRGQIAAASGNLLDLDDLFTYKRLRGDGDIPPAKLAGATAARAAPALAAVADLWRYTERLTDTVDRASRLRKPLSRLWCPERTLHEIEQILQGPSVALPPVETPLSQRGLLSAGESAQSTTLQRLLDVMTRDFTLARDTILAVDSAWNRLEPSLAQAEADAEALQKRAEELGEGTFPELDAARRQIAQLRSAVATDPLGADADFIARIAPLLGRAGARLEELVQRREQTETDLRRARQMMQEITAAQQQCAAALAECQQKIAMTAGLREPPPDSARDDLQSWLATLEDAHRQSRWAALRVGLTRWLGTASPALDALHTACAANRAPLEAREELRGRLAAMRIKAQALAARGREPDPSLATLAEEAEQLLRDRPTPLDRAAALVAQYEARLAGPPKK